MFEPQIMDKVRIVHTTDLSLDGQSATVIGFHGLDAIILFDTKPFERDMAIVITIHCLERI